MIRTLIRTVINLVPVLCALVIGCGENKAERMRYGCIVGSDTLSMERICHLAPDSLTPIQKTGRVALEIMLIKNVHDAKTPPPDTALAKRIAEEFAEQLSRQSSDAWSIDASHHLYQAVKMLRILFLRSRSFSLTVANLDSLAEKSIIYGDGAMAREMVKNTKLSIPAAGVVNSSDSLERFVGNLFFLPSAIAHVACEFAATAETPRASSQNINGIIKGLIVDSARLSRAPSETKARPKTGASLEVKNNSLASLAQRSQASIKDSIEKHIPDLEALYKKYLKIHQNMAGSIITTFQILPNGSVASARINTSKITEKDFLEPLRNYFLKNMHFKPIPEKFGEMEVEFPFEFTPEN